MTRTKRSNGVASRETILDAAAEIAGERGYDGTGIKAVSERSGLPASSIYWHFDNKDELIAAVIDRSFTAWVESLETALRSGDDAADSQLALRASFGDSARRLLASPDFLRLGLMLTLEQRDEELSARRRFREVRASTLDGIERNLRRTFPHLDDSAARRLAVLTMAAADGLFVAAGAGECDLVDAFETLADTIHAAATTERSAVDHV